MTGALLAVEGLSCSYPAAGGGRKAVFGGVGFSVAPGETFVLIGPNGSGKTTLLNCIAGLQDFDGGAVRVCGRDIGAMPYRERAKAMGYLTQLHETALEYTVLEYLVMGRAPHLGFLEKPGDADYARAMEVLEGLGIAHYAGTPMNQLSGGEHQQARIGRVLMQDARLVLMDEPTNHLDYGNQIRVLKRIRGLAGSGRAVLMTSHAPDHITMLQSRVGVLGLEDGFRVGSPSEILRGEVLEKLYGAKIAVHHVGNPSFPVCVPEELIQ
ncbi:MAG: ABC transporter ATP-binding protein [Clostridiales Family XIII bacterium]|nr:ABC transporter ATP-binding protein [Clostridiales Family XIII bacterium]